ncbi:MAG: OmpA family protein [Candidatus Sumerlaeota bacterium]|nr:OmpA family protein [Candidatus Sumerlaeota bacterium]
MGKRKKEPEPHANHERWLVSYADFITLLFAFFVVMFAASNSNKNKLAESEKAFVAAFESWGLFPSLGRPELIDKGANTGDAALSIKPRDILSPNVTPNPDEAMNSSKKNPGMGNGFTSSSLMHPDMEPSPTPKPEYAEDGIGMDGSAKIKSFFAILRKALDKDIQEGRITIRMDKRGVTVSLQEMDFVNPGSAELKEAAQATLDRLAAKLVEIGKNNVILRVEGHTDDSPLPEKCRFQDPQELSGARAGAVLNRLLIHEFSPQNLVASGYGKWRPAFSNQSPEGRSANRRVDIVILNDAFATIEAKARIVMPPPLRIPSLTRATESDK